MNTHKQLNRQKHTKTLTISQKISKQKQITKKQTNIHINKQKHTLIQTKKLIQTYTHLHTPAQTYQNIDKDTHKHKYTHIHTDTQRYTKIQKKHTYTHTTYQAKLQQ